LNPLALRCNWSGGSNRWSDMHRPDLLAGRAFSQRSNVSSEVALPEAKEQSCA
jgi:hypothetical protein